MGLCLKRVSKFAVVSALFYISFASTYAIAPSVDLQKQFQTIQNEYKNDPSFDVAKKVNQELEGLNDKDGFVASNPNDPFSKKFKTFHMQILQLVNIHDRLDACAKNDVNLRTKVDSLGDVLSQATAKGDVGVCPECKKEYDQAMAAIDATTSCVNPSVTAPNTADENYKNMLRMGQAMQEEYLDRQRSSGSTAQQRPLAGNPDSDHKNRVEKQRQTGEMNHTIATHGDERQFTIDQYVDKEFGFDAIGRLQSEANRAKARENAKKLHLALMKGNRTNNFKNYIYFSQHFAFAGPDILNLPPNDYSLSGAALNMYDTIGWDGNHTLSSEKTLVDDPRGSKYPKIEVSEADRLDWVGRDEVARIKSEYGTHAKLSVDDVYDRLAPFLSTQLSDKNPSQEITNQLQTSEAGFIFYTNAFKNSKNKLIGKTPAEIKSLMSGIIKDAVKESIENTRDYAKWIKVNQNTINMYGEKYEDDYAQLSSILLYSSPNVIREVIGKNPQLLGSLCLPMQYAAKEGDASTPDWLLLGGGAISTFSGPFGRVATFAVSTMITMESHLRTERSIAQKDGFTGAGDNYLERNWPEYKADKADLKAKFQAHEDAMLTDMIMFAASEAAGYVGGRVIRFVGGKAIKVIKLAKTARSLANELGLPEDVEKATINEIKQLIKQSEKDFGRQLTNDEIKALYLAKMHPEKATEILKSAHFPEKDIKTFVSKAEAPVTQPKVESPKKIGADTEPKKTPHETPKNTPEPVYVRPIEAIDHLHLETLGVDANKIEKLKTAMAGRPLSEQQELVILLEKIKKENTTDKGLKEALNDAFSAACGK